jgi:hypothetical protein
MIWGACVVDLADHIEKLINDRRRHEALKLFRELRKITCIDPPQELKASSLPTAPRFGSGPLPDED